jgi:hypothetical protein
MRSSFEDGSGLAYSDNRIELPKVPMDRGAHYKVLAVLDRTNGATGKKGEYPPPKVDCATGRLELTGSTAFEPVARSYQDACPGVTRPVS